MGKIPRRKPCHWTERDLETLNVDLQAVRECIDERAFFGTEEATLELAGVSLVELEYLIKSPFMRSSTDTLDVDTCDLYDTARLHKERDSGRKVTFDYVDFVEHMDHLIGHQADYAKIYGQSSIHDSGSDEEVARPSDMTEGSDDDEIDYDVDDEMLCHESQRCFVELMRLVQGGISYGLFQAKHRPTQHFGFKDYPMLRDRRDPTSSVCAGRWLWHVASEDRFSTWKNPQTIVGIEVSGRCIAGSAEGQNISSVREMAELFTAAIWAAKSLKAHQVGQSFITRYLIRCRGQSVWFLKAVFPPAYVAAYLRNQPWGACRPQISILGDGVDEAGRLLGFRLDKGLGLVKVIRIVLEMLALADHEETERMNGRRVSQS